MLFYFFHMYKQHLTVLPRSLMSASQLQTSGLLLAVILCQLTFCCLIHQALLFWAPCTSASNEKYLFQQYQFYFSSNLLLNSKKQRNSHEVPMVSKKQQPPSHRVTSPCGQSGNLATVKPRKSRELTEPGVKIKADSKNVSSSPTQQCTFPFLV